MRLATFALLSFFCTLFAWAKDADVEIAWMRVYSNSWLRIMPDNLGHIAATGSEGTDIVVRLLSTQGRQIGREIVPIPALMSAVADDSGRIFVTGNTWASKSVSCAAYAPRLSRLLWTEERNLSNAFSRPNSMARINTVVPGNDGSVYVSGEWDRGLYFNQFRGDASGILSYWDTFGGTYARFVTTSARSQSGEIYFIGTSVGFTHYFFITIQKFTPTTGEIQRYGVSSPWSSFSFATAGTRDADGNLIVV